MTQLYRSSRPKSRLMVVSAVGMAALEPRLTVTDFEALGKSVLDEQIEDPVDARPSGGTPEQAQLVLNLDGAERAGLGRQQLDDALAGAAALQSRLREHGVHVLTPLRCCHRPSRLAPGSDITVMRLNLTL